MTLVVSAAVVEREGRLLITRRPKGTHLEGLWEFPGGKCEPGESLADCLRRELIEELGTDAHVGNEIFMTRHDYHQRSVELHFFACTLIGEPRALIGQEILWARRDELRSLKFPPADDQLIELLSQP